MPLFKPSTKITSTPEESIASVHAFMKKCLSWAEEKEIPATLAKLQDNPDPKLAARLQQWTTYREFTLHTLRELEDGTLDHWFDSDRKPDEQGSNGI